MKVLHLIFILSVALLASADAHAASFDCRPYFKSRTCPEIVICDTAHLSQRDDQMAQMYELLMERLQARRAVFLRQDQRAWLAQRKNCECDATCIAGLYDRRIQELDGYEQASGIFESLPQSLRNDIEETRESCRELGRSLGQPSEPRYNPSGDFGLLTFSIDERPAVLIDELQLCGDGTECHKGINCATGFTHLVEIYINTRARGWQKYFSEHLTEPVHLSTDRASGRFNFLAFKLAGGGEECPIPPKIERKHGGTSWKHFACDYILRWNGKRFIRLRM